MLAFSTLWHFRTRRPEGTRPDRSLVRTHRKVPSRSCWICSLQLSDTSFLSLKPVAMSWFVQYSGTCKLGMFSSCPAGWSHCSSLPKWKRPLKGSSFWLMRMPWPWCMPSFQSPSYRFHMPVVHFITPTPSRRLATNCPLYSAPPFHRRQPSPDMQSSENWPLYTEPSVLSRQPSPAALPLSNWPEYFEPSGQVITPKPVRMPLM
mmetsp:Transcript_39432/g.111562  ORF Transcript_39432/g.111562 Transcript_39432/m.111562 type:complete len:205 (+) Transcript_39432:653-1267(+)